MKSLFPVFAVLALSSACGRPGGNPSQTSVLTSEETACASARSEFLTELGTLTATPARVSREVVLDLVAKHPLAVKCSSLDNETLQPRLGWRIWKARWYDNPELSQFADALDPNRLYTSFNLDTGRGYALMGFKTGFEIPVLSDFLRKVGLQSSIGALALESKVVSGSSPAGGVFSFESFGLDETIKRGDDLVQRLYDLENQTRKILTVPGWLPAFKAVIGRQDPCNTLYIDGEVWLVSCLLSNTGKYSTEIYDRVETAN